MNAARSPFILMIWLLVSALLGSSVQADETADLSAAYALARKLESEGKSDAAVIQYQKALAAARRISGADSRDAAVIGDNLANLYKKIGQHAKAEPLLQHALAYCETQLGKDHLTTADVLINLAGVHLAMAQFAKAEPLQLRALAIRETKLGRDHISTASALNELACLYDSTSRYAKAGELHLRALAIREAKLAKDHPDVAISLANLANVYKQLGQYAKAEPFYQRALAIREKTLGQDHPITATILSNLGSLYCDMGRFAEAEPVFRRALRIAEASGHNNADIAQALSNLGYLYCTLGQYAKAEPLYERALAITEVTLGNHPETADSLNQLANLYTEMGRYAKAEPHHQRALSIRERMLGDHPDTAQSLNNLASLYMQMAQSAKAEPLYRRALAVHEATLGKNHSLTSTTVNNLATLYDETGQFEKAEPLYQRALAIREEALGKDHPDTAALLYNLASFYCARSEFAKAEPLFERALAIRESKFGKHHPTTALSLNGLAVLFAKKGQHTKAEPLHHRALAIREGTLGKNHPESATVIYNLATLYAATDEFERASRYLDRLRRQVREFISDTLPILSHKEQTTFVKLRDEARFHMSLSLGLERRNNALERDLSAGWLLNGKAVAAQVQAESVQLARESRDPQIGPMSRQLVEARKELAALTLQSPTGMEDASRNRKVTELAAKEQVLSQQLSKATGRSLGAKWVELSVLRKALPREGVLVEIARFNRKNLTGKSGEKASFGYRYAAWIIPPTGDVQIVDLGDAGPIDAAVSAARTEFESAEKTIAVKGEPAAEKQLRKPMADLAKLVLQPLLPHIKDYETWIISPDGQLWLAPWAALPLVDGSYAIEKHTMQFVVTGRDLLTPKNEKVTPTTPVVMADPDFDALPKASGLGGLSCPGNIGDWKVTFAFRTGEVVKIIDAVDGSEAGEGKWSQVGDTLTIRTSRATFTGTLSNGKASGERVIGTTRDRWALQVPGAGHEAAENRGLSKDFKLGRIKRLPGTAMEAEAILPQLAKYVGSDAKLFTEQTARVEEFKNLKNPRVVILSTHGFFLEEEKIERNADARGLMMDDRKPTGPISENPLLRCGLLLAGCNHAATAPPGGDTGVLTGLEIVGTDLRGTELVVLSACETGLGDVRNGEGVAGLRQAFQLAGAESVVATLWQVPDRDSALLMASFFDKLAAKQARDVALAEAQREMIKNRRDRFGAAHPYFWAAYTLTGQAK